MRLSAPKNVTWWIALVMGVAGILATFTNLPFVTDNSFWFVAIAFILLALATLLKDL